MRRRSVPPTLPYPAETEKKKTSFGNRKKMSGCPHHKMSKRHHNTHDFEELWSGNLELDNENGEKLNFLMIVLCMHCVKAL